MKLIAFPLSHMGSCGRNCSTFEAIAKRPLEQPSIPAAFTQVLVARCWFRLRLSNHQRHCSAEDYEESDLGL